MLSLLVVEVTQPFWKTVQDRIAADPEFAQALSEEGVAVQGGCSASAPAPANMEEQHVAANTDRALWCESSDWLSPVLFVTDGGGIGMNVGGHVIVKPIRDWHALAASTIPKPWPQ